MKLENAINLLLIQTALVACVVQNSPTPTIAVESELTSAFATQVPVDNWNESLTVELTETVNGKPQQLTSGSTIALRIENKSDQVIILPDDYGVRLLSYSQQQDAWETVSNNFSYAHLQPQSKLLSPNGVVDNDIIWMKIVYIHPVPNISQQIQMRIVVTGNFYANSVLGKEVGAYTDILLGP
jgi:hypothetical protein